LTDPAVRPDHDTSRKRRAEAFMRVLDKLPEKKRTVFVLHEIEGQAPADIAVVVDAPVLTVRTRLFYARREICELMRAEPALVELAEEFEKELLGPKKSSDDGAASGNADPTEGDAS
jgi:RNA polymerase sigma-70 factor (ECF subfamily)